MLNISQMNYLKSIVNPQITDSVTQSNSNTNLSNQNAVANQQAINEIGLQGNVTGSKLNIIA